MLTQVRGALKGAVMWFFVVLLILAFALWGVPGLDQMSGNAAVSVGSKNYSAQYVQQEFNRAVQVRSAESGGSFSREDAFQSGLPQQIVASITTTAALDQFAEKMNLKTPRAVVADYLQNNEGFQNPATGQFDRMVLSGVLQRFNISAEEFERRIAEELQRQQLLESLATQSSAPQTLTQFTLMRETERREISYLIVTEEMAGKPAEPTPDDLRSYYEANPDAFTAPEYRTFDLLTLRTDDFRAGVGVAEEDLRQLYEANRARVYEKPERRTLYQITFDTEAGAQAAASALRQGKSFEEIAEQRGMSLDDVTFAEAQKRDILDPGVAEAAFAEGLEEGDVIDPVQSLFGWTVAQIAGVTAPETTSFEEAREEMEDQLLAQDVRRAMMDAIDEVEEVRDTGAGLEAAADAAGLEITTFGPVDRYSFAPGGAIVDGIPGEALAEAFLLEEGRESEALDLSTDDGYFFVALREIREPAIIPYEDLLDEVADRWRKEEREQRIADTVRDIRESVESGESLADAASQFDRAPTTLTIDRRFENDVISPELNQQIFLAAPDGVVAGDVALGEAKVVATINDVVISTNAAPPEQQAFYRQYLGYQLDQELIDAFLIEVRNEYDVKINQAQIDALFSNE